MDTTHELSEIIEYPEPTDVAGWARSCREAVNMTQEQWAVLTGISSSTVSRTERGLVIPHKRTLWKMSRCIQKTEKTPPASIPMKAATTDHSPPSAMSVLVNSSETHHPSPSVERDILVPAEPGVYFINDFRVIVRRRRDLSVYLRNERIRFLASQRGWSRTAFSRETGVDNSYTCPKIWTHSVTRVTAPTAERIRATFDVPLAEIAFLNAQGEPYNPECGGP